MYERTRQMDSFHIHGFQYWDGALALASLKAGEDLELRAEADNPHDADAVALYYQGAKLGYVPACRNALLAQLLHFGHEGVVEARVLQVDPQADPWEQVRVGIYMTDAR